MSEQPNQISATANRSSDWLAAPSYWKPEQVPPSAWFEHAPFAFWLMDALKPRTVVELGTHAGYSYFVFCTAIVRLRLDTSAFALDSWEGDDHAGFYDESVYNEVHAINEEHYQSFSTLVRGYFDEGLERFDDSSIDLLHIDGRHGYEDVRHDFESWRPKMSERGVVLFHDIAERQEGFGVWKFWEEVRERYPSFAFEHGHGLGVLATGPNVAPAVARFIAAGKTFPNEVRRAYEQLGAEITAQVAREDVSSQRAALLVDRESRLEEQQTLLIERMSAIAERDAQIQELHDRLVEAERQAAEIRASTTWKVTAPLRAVSASLRRGKR